MYDVCAVCAMCVCAMCVCDVCVCVRNVFVCAASIAGDAFPNVQPSELSLLRDAALPGGCLKPGGCCVPSCTGSTVHVTEDGSVHFLIVHHKARSAPAGPALVCLGALVARPCAAAFFIPSRRQLRHRPHRCVSFPRALHVSTL